ncbi:putative lipid II flippase FtsW [candidate division KSB1 bacterium]|nr:putative lipid II flippase FtsW [candidate division KSB1 bacterium]NIR71831.1 putative lipid II flippase FtsW [candidate division KSB1 bacterium]NIS25347.1 putative lipid II flippase FtsW [candidate division KSB1 bacterium]NIT71817.1 putative lipid II flippase FtsW [candidate division KSB1 bacterium]NIU25555.1 putative lipid II flippase FtsW [candidate division KSB1 bacterium]
MPKDRFAFDSTLFIVVIVLLVFGVVMVYSASSFKAQEERGDNHFYLKNHFYKVGIAFLLMLVVAKIKYTFWLKMSPYILFLSFCALIFLLVSPTVEAIRGSRRWIILGPVQFQPSDFARMALVLFLSHSLGRNDFKTKEDDNHFYKMLAVVGLIALPVLLQPDIGTAGLLVLIAVTLIFLSGEKLRHLLLLPLISTPLFLLYLQHSDYQRQRVLQYIASLKGEELSWQTQQSLIALGNGSFFGLGLGSGRQKYHFLPDPFTDFIYAIIGEEFGVLGTVAILALFAVLIWRGFKIALRALDSKARLLGVGIVLNIAVYVIANAGVVTNLLPTTGIPMPFLSYGGSALLVNLFGVGILLNISAQNRANRRVNAVSNIYRRGQNIRRYGRSRTY